MTFAIITAYLFVSALLLSILISIDHQFSWAKVREAFMWPWTVISVGIEELRR